MAFRGGAGFPKYQESLTIFGNDKTILTATPTWAGSGSQFRLALGVGSSPDGPFTWEDVTNGSTHTFTASGIWLAWKAVGLDYLLTSLEVVISTS